MNMVKKLVGAHKNRWDVYLPLEGAGPRRKGPREAASRLRARCPRQARRPDVVFVRNLYPKSTTPFPFLRSAARSSAMWTTSGRLRRSLRLRRGRCGVAPKRLRNNTLRIPTPPVPGEH
eukprot:Polyplicarium_translucidae@DN3210_c0_g1_i5.p2